MPVRALTFGTVAEAYERYRPDYPQPLYDLIAGYAGHPIRTAVEIGAGTGKATRLLAANGVTVTATEPDPAMLTELRRHVPSDVIPLRAAFEDLTTGDYDLFYAAAALHWTNPDGRWQRVASLLAPDGVVAVFGGPLQLTDAGVERAVRSARAPFLESDEFPSPDGTGPDAAMQWPGTELERSPLFTDVRQHVIERRVTMTAEGFLGHLSTVSAYLEIPPAPRAEVFRRIADVLPETVELTADVFVHLARRSSENPATLSGDD
ncbi:putative methyltransferase [Actinoplanes missouriensis 431]|uniref:Putative methyltransferase n=1 Tax=Actinoplanes missouriensis (strain ATCC 14538 / DSM 43046 / CBS 188.64 / JCM 3121 / NBRC 102363 / NCIMB 12654 / NRRL B-3342 / UNCC 431) TaxID=512565 RepID=I0HDS7_ACTM4|nr:class I SAM-dependent methyltransferase [Actinoplanes missouriensis]BAL91164.1 putative methyltransferase [Actinoplanes missouriensis 431]